MCQRLRPTKPVSLAILISLLATVVQALPEGFEINVLTTEVPYARQMAQSANGTIYVGSRGPGNVYAVTPTNDYARASVEIVASGLTLPSGIAIVENDLIIAALNEVLRISNVDESPGSCRELELITDKLPSDRHHGWKYLEADTDSNIYFNIGAPCNTCLSADEQYATIVQMNMDSGNYSIYAHGVRNSVGFAWHPVTNLLWFSDNGRDWMGSEMPFEEINVVTEPGQHFGYPFIHAGLIKDPEFGEGKDPDDYEKPVHDIRAHSAALGLAFYTADMFPDEYTNALFIAEHGSWNHAPGPPRGYRVTVLFEESDDLRYEVFFDDWSVVDKSTGRPNDVLVAADGSLLISDDGNGAIYRVTYSGE